MADLFDHETEAAVLSLLATESTTSISDARLMLEGSRLTREDFHLPGHGAIFDAARRLLVEKGLPVDPLTVKGELKSDEAVAGLDRDMLLGAIWTDERFHLKNSFPGYCKSLRDLSLRRRLVSEGRQIASQASDLTKDPDTILSSATSRLAATTGTLVNVRTLREVMGDIAHDLEGVQGGGRIPVVPTGIRVLDRVIGGWQPTLNLVGALPGVGKSALAAASVHYMAQAGFRPALFSLEDEVSWLGWRLLAHEAGVTQFKMRFQRMDPLDIARTKNGFRKVHGYAEEILTVDGSENGMGVEEIVARSNDLIVNHKADVILIDHLGEVALDLRNAELPEATGRALSRFRGIANRHGVPVVVFAHLKRRDGLEAGTPPLISDFANSSGAERKARVAVGLYRAPDSDVLGMSVLKNTMGKAAVRVEAEFIGAAAMVRAVEGAGE